MKAQARSIIRTVKDSEQWFDVEGVDREDIIESLRYRAMVAVGASLVHIVKSGGQRGTTRRHVFTTDGAHVLEVDIKWNEDNIERVSFTVSPDSIVSEVMASMLTGKGAA